MSNNEQVKLSAARQQIYNTMMSLLNEKDLSWVKTWQDASEPVCFSTEKGYKGNNNFLLSIVAHNRGYKDNRWITFNQMQKAGLNFKKDETGKSLANKQGVPIEFFTFYDKSTKKPIDWKAYRALDKDERYEYWKKNIKPIAQSYTVFNCDLVENCPKAKKQFERLPESERLERAENLLKIWSDTESKIANDGRGRAFYRILVDTVHLPEYASFKTPSDYYGTGFHEVGHSTGAKHRLKRDGIINFEGFGSPSYAAEELVAEISSVFICKELGVTLSDEHLKNHAAYIDHWRNIISENPNALFIAFSQANKAANLVLAKENVSAAKQEAMFDAEAEMANNEARLEQETANKLSERVAQLKNMTAAELSQQTLTKEEFLAFAAAFGIAQEEFREMRDERDNLVGVQWLDDGNANAQEISKSFADIASSIRFSRLTEEEHEDLGRRSNLQNMVANMPKFADRASKGGASGQINVDSNEMVNARG